MFRMQLFTPGKEPLYQLNRKVDGPQSWFGGSGKEKCHFTLLGFKIQIVQCVIQSLYQLCYPGSHYKY